MNINKANKQFKKLSSFYQSISADGEINKIELDLLKTYVLKFYDSIIDTSNVAAQVEEIETPVTKEAPVAAPQPRLKEVAAIAASVAPEVTTNGQEQKTSTMKADVKSLFSLATGNEISDKLAITSIADIGKSMSINERIFTIKELFNGDQELFNTAISNLNNLDSYDAAQSYLADEIVDKCSWLDDSKAKKVKTFMKLVYRKYV